MKSVPLSSAPETPLRVMAKPYTWVGLGDGGREREGVGGGGVHVGIALSSAPEILLREWWLGHIRGLGGGG